MKLKYDLEYCEHANECTYYCPYICDEHCEWDYIEPFTYEQNWDNDGMIDYKNDKTLKRYRELCNERNKCDINAYDCFFAFSNDQFKEGLAKIRPLNEGEKLISFGGGGYGTKDGFEKLCKYYDDMRAKIANECNPVEVYIYEYNNHESFISWDGDMGAIQVIIDTFGIEAARKIKRISAMYSLEELSK